MTRQTLRLIAIFLILLPAVLAMPVYPAQAEDGIALVSQQAEHYFGQLIRFTAGFQATTPITGISLFLAAQNDLRIFTVDIPIPAGQSRVTVEYTLNLTQYPLHPFSQVEYWWHVEAEDQSALETEPDVFRYTDNRYVWHATPDETQEFHVYSTSADPLLGYTALRIARQGLQRIVSILPGDISGPIDIYIYPTGEEMRSALQLSGREWVGGQTDLEWGVILVSSDDSETSLINLQRTLPHEIAHVVINERAGGQQGRVPAWLHEGLAIINEDNPDPTLYAVLDQALAQDALLSLESLCTLFPYTEQTALLAYAESASFVRFLQNRYGNQQLARLVATYGDGANCSGAVQRTLAASLTDLEQEWLADLRGEQQQGPAGEAAGDLIPWLGLLVGGTLLVGGLYLLRPRILDSVTNERAG